MADILGYESFDDLETATMAKNFFALDEKIFLIPESLESNDMLARVIDHFHIITNRLGLEPPIINKGSKNSFCEYHYEFEYEKGILLDVHLYTPEPKTELSTINMSDDNTQAFIRWPNYFNAYSLIRPLENAEDKKDYLTLMQSIIAKSIEKEYLESQSDNTTN